MSTKWRLKRDVGPFPAGMVGANDRCWVIFANCHGDTIKFCVASLAESPDDFEQFNDAPPAPKEVRCVINYYKDRRAWYGLPDDSYRRLDDIRGDEIGYEYDDGTRLAIPFAFRAREVDIAVPPRDRWVYDFQRHNDNWQPVHAVAVILRGE